MRSRAHRADGASRSRPDAGRRVGRPIPLIIAVATVMASAIAFGTSTPTARADSHVGAVTVSDIHGLATAIDSANSGGPKWIYLTPGGAYGLTALPANKQLELKADGIRLIGADSTTSPSAATFVIDGGTQRSGLIIAADDVVVSGVTIKRTARSNGSGAAITVRRGADRFVLADSSIEDNHARDGGGMTIEPSSSATVRGSTFVGNTAVRKGGGIRAEGRLDVVNSTFTVNTAQSGGAISVAGVAGVSFSTFVDNTSNNAKGGGVDRNGGTLLVTGSILTRANQQSTDGSDCSGNPDLIGPNFVGSAQGCNPDSSVLIGTVVGPLPLGALQDNLGPTHTIAIPEGSIVADRADATQCTTIASGPAGPVRGAAVTVDQRGVSRPQGAACDLGAYEAVELTVTVDLSSDTLTPFVGAEILPAGAIGPSVVQTDQLFRGSLSASPLNAFPLEAAPLNAFPLNAFPLNAFPLNAFPLSAFDTAAAPLNAFPLSAFPLNAFPLNAFPLNDLVLTDTTWDEVLADTEFAGVPTQSLTLGDVIGVDVVGEMSLADFNLEGTPLSAFPLSAFLLAGVPLNAFPLNAFGTGVETWCDLVPDFCAAPNPDVVPTSDEFTLASLALAGVPLNAFPLSAFPLSAFYAPDAESPLAASPLNAFPLNAFQWQASPLNAFPLNAFPLSAFDGVIDCDLVVGGSCGGATLGDAAGAFDADATLASLAALFAAHPEALAVLDALGITLADLVAGVIPADSIPWEQLDLGVPGVQNAGDPDKWTFQYLADLTLTEPAETTTIELTLPPAFAYGLTGAKVDGVAVDTASVSLRCANAESTDCLGDQTVVVIELANLSGGNHRVSIPSRAGFTLVDVARAQVDVTAANGSTEATATDTHDVSVVAPDGGVRPIVATGSSDCAGFDGDTNLGWSSAPTDDVHLYTFEVTQDAARCGLRADIFLSNLPIDFDLTLYGPIADPLRGPPIASMGYLDDVTLDLNPFDDVIQADTVQDIPQRLPGGLGFDPDAYAVVATASNRGTNDDRIRTGTLREGIYFLQVSAYNGASSNEPYALRMRTDGSVAPLECTALPAPEGSPGQLPVPASLPAGVNTLFLVNEQLLEYQYGAPARADVIAKAKAVADAADLGVIGAVVPVDGDADVQSAYAARFADPCDPFAANDVVRAIGAVIDRYTAVRDIANIVIIGDDRQIPFANIVDDANYANERTFAHEFDEANESTGALAAGMYRSDDPYGSDAGLRIRDHELFVPTRAVGRLVERPADIIASLDNFITYDGKLDTDTERTAFQSGYEFLEDGAELNAANLIDDEYMVTRLFGETWTDSDAVDALDFRHDVVGLHAHFDQNNALPAFENFNGVTSPADLLSSDELPIAVDRAVVYSMGCHSGWSFSDVQVGVTAPDTAPDWAQELTASRSNVFMGNTGFGYGDTDRVALTEQLTALFADEIGGDGSVGDAWVAAKQRMASDILVIDAYQEKSLQQFVFYGLPMFHTHTAPPDLSAARDGTAEFAAAIAAASATELVALDSDPNGQRIANVEVTRPLDDFVLEETADGDYYSIDDRVLTVNGHPVQPLHAADLPTVPGMRAQDALITELSSQDVNNFDPLFFWASPNYGGPRPEYSDGSFPAEMASVRTTKVRGEDSQQLLLAAGQYRADDVGPDLGTQRLHPHVATEVYYVPDTTTDFAAPLISKSRGYVDDDAVLFEVESDASTTRVFVLYRAEGGVVWSGIDLVIDGAQWRGVGPFPTGSGEVEFIVQAVDDNGNVAMSNNKSQYFLAAAPGEVSDLQLTVTNPPDDPASGWYTGAVEVTATNVYDDADVAFDILYRIGAGDFLPYDETAKIDLPANPPGQRLVTAIDTSGAFAALTVKIDAERPTVAINLPVAWTQGPVTVTLTADDGNGSGVAQILYSLDGGTLWGEYDPAEPPSVSSEGVTVQAKAIDVAGNESLVASASVPIDVTDPTATLDLVGPDLAGEIAAGATATATYSCGDARSDIASCVLRIDNVVASATSPAPLPTNMLGLHTVTLTATDFAGNDLTTTRTYTVVDRTAPTPDLSVNGTTFGPTGATPTATYSCTDATPSSGLTSCTLVVTDTSGATLVSTWSNGVSTAFALPNTIPTTPNAPYTVTVTATDGAGNSASTNAQYRAVDDVKPTPSLAVTAPTTGNPATATYGCTDAHSSIATCKIEAKAPNGTVVFTETRTSGTDKTVSIPTGASGTYTVVVTATDTWGNTASTTPPGTFTYLPELCVRELYTYTQSKNIGTNYTIKIELCDANLPKRLVLEAKAITRALNGVQYAPGPNDSGSSNNLFEFRYSGKDGYIYNLNTTGLSAVLTGPELFTLDFVARDGNTILGTGRARFTLRP